MTLARSHFIHLRLLFLLCWTFLVFNPAQISIALHSKVIVINQHVLLTFASTLLFGSLRLFTKKIVCFWYGLKSLNLESFGEICEFCVLKLVLIFYERLDLVVLHKLTHSYVAEIDLNLLLLVDLIISACLDNLRLRDLNWFCQDNSVSLLVKSLLYLPLRLFIDLELDK